MFCINGKVKCTLVQTLSLCTGRTAHRGSRGIALPFLDHSTRRGWGVSVTPRPLFTPGKDLVPIVQEAGWAPGPVWTGAENVTPIGVWSPDCPARNQSLYRLRYPAPMFCMHLFNFVNYVLLLLCMFCSVYSVFIVPAGTLRLSWLRFIRAFSSVVRQMPGYDSQRQGMAGTLPN